MGENTLRLSDLERIGGQIPGGFFVYRAEEPLEMLYINDNVLHIFGCDTPEEFRELTGNTFRGMVYADDFAAIQSSIDEQIADSANEIRSGLLAGISHDIRSPMRTIA